MADPCPLCARFDEPANTANVSKYNDPNKMFEHAAHITATVSCERCGNFRILLGKYLEKADVNTLLRLSGHVRIETNAGREPVELTNENLAELASRAPVPRTMGAYYDRLLQLIAARCDYPGAETPQFPLALVAAEAFLPTLVCKSAIEQFSEFILPLTYTLDLRRARYRLSPQGWRRVDDLTRQGLRGDRAFVAMWFDPQMTTAYQEGFQAALQACGYEPPFRVDDDHHQERANEPDFKNRIDDRILAEIRRARFVIADATGARPSVYYEAGFADGLGTPVIWTCREDGIESVSFDTRQTDHILWRDVVDLRAKLTARIERRGWKRG